ncbi:MULTISPECIES: hypothetical protein [Aeromicrobium]|uniref:hypothetical protein n=1 Tax=Aeromicrobium TaxID=2040 RepID=UPI000A8C56D2|nr:MULTISPECIES: hypothetical protein [Aeromicrobium]MCL8251805.1 hypothetical protein [Aeromicrobium fastidiosum]
MRAWIGALTLVAASSVLGACTSSADGPAPAPTSPAPTAEASTTLTAQGIDWPRAGSPLPVADPPAAPDGFGAALVTRMADVLTTWAGATTVDPDVWHVETPADAVVDALPPAVGAALTRQAADAVSPGLAVANVFGDDVEVIGEPAVTTAWRVTTKDDDAGQQYVVVQLQTRAAYEVRLGDDGPTRVVGVLRVHGLSAYPGTEDDFGVTTGWQEFGAGDCALAVDDALVPDNDLDKAAADLATFVDVGDQPDVRMPALDDEEKVDDAYRDRCRDGTT